MRVTQPLQRNLQQIPHEIATVDGDRRQTWAEFVDRVARLAGALQALGVAPGDRVAVIGLNSDRHMEVFFAVPWAGGVIVPTNYRWSAPEIAFSLNDSGTRVLFVDHHFWPLVAELRSLVEHSLTVIPHGWRSAGADAEQDALSPPMRRCRNRSRAPRLSASSHRGHHRAPKGVMLSHGNHVANTLQFAAMIDFGAEVVYLHAAPMFHIADALYIYLVTHGGRHVFIPRFEPAACARALQDHGVTDTILVPTMIQMLLEQPGLDGYDLGAFKRLYYGASPMPEAVAMDLIRKLPHVAAYQLYGQTESGPRSPPSTRYHVTRVAAGRLRRPVARPRSSSDRRWRGSRSPRGTVGETSPAAPTSAGLLGT